MAGILASSLTLEDVVTYYLYGTNEIPENYGDRLRPDAAVGSEIGVTLQIDAPNFMASGPGRYANISQVPLVQLLFSGSAGLIDFENAFLSPGQTSISIAELLSKGLSLSDIEMSLTQYQMDAGSNDYMLRGYVWSSELFRLNDDAIIDFGNPGQPVISNVCLRPFNDDFDYISDNSAIQLSNALSMDTVDPYAIGRMVAFEFVDKDLISKQTTYDNSSFGQDTDRWDSQYNGDLVDGFRDVFLAGNDELKDSDLLDYNLPDGGNVIYGSDAANIVDGVYGYINTLTVKTLLNGTKVWVSSDAATPMDGSHVVFPGDETTIVVGGGGDDIITTGAGNDYLYGGTGIDHLYGGEGSDHLFGNAGDDFLNAASKLDPNETDPAQMFDAAYDDVSDILSGGTGFDTYYVSGTADYLAKVFEFDENDENDPGRFRSDVFNFVDVIDDVDGQGLIFNIDPEDDKAFTIGNRSLTFTYMRDNWGMAQYETNVGPENAGWSGFTAVPIDHDGVHYLAMTWNDNCDVAYFIKNFHDGDFGITLVAA